MSKDTHSFFFISEVSGERAYLSPEEIHHARAALRIDRASFIEATDGKGTVYTCKLTDRSRETGEIEIEGTAWHQPDKCAMDLYIGLPDRQVFEDVLPSLVALGVSRIIPIICSYCQDHWWHPWEKRVERFQRKMISGIKQAKNPWMPELSGPQPIASALQTVCDARSENTWQCVADAQGVALHSALPAITGLSRIACFIGPPGGFSPEEMNRFSIGEFSHVKIARYRLRTELAAVALCTAIKQQGL
jgi:16S rRNA (uracil1498-N3)-methyltransferase